MVPSPSHSFVLLPPLGASLSYLITMLAFIQAVCALSLSSLLLQAEANPLPHLDELQETVEPGRTGAVASESDICSEIGINLLQRGGNAADAVHTNSHYEKHR